MSLRTASTFDIDGGNPILVILALLEFITVHNMGSSDSLSRILQYSLQ